MDYPPMNEQRCSSCRYYRPDVDFAPERWYCHRHPPQLGPRGGQWPEVDAADWCGEWCGR